MQSSCEGSCGTRTPDPGLTLEPTTGLGVPQVNMLTSSKGNILRCDVNGKIVMKAFLSGMPDVKLGLNDKLEVRAPEPEQAPHAHALACRP